MERKLSLSVSAVISIVLLTIVTVYGTPDPFIKGYLHIDVQREEYQAGETAELYAAVENLNSFPIIDGYLVIEIVDGPPSPVYPAHISDDDNVIDGIIISNISILPGQKKELTYGIPLPDDMNPGEYRIDVFFKTPRTPIVGIPFIFIPGKSSSFTVINGKPSASAKIIRTETEIAGKPGQTGPSVYSEDPLTGRVVIENDGDTELVDFRLDVSLHRWDDTENGPDASITETIASLSPGERKAIDIEIDVPDDIPKTAYSVKMKLYGERTLSVYRSRINLIGEGCRIGKLIPNKASYEKGEEGSAEVLVIGPSDKISTLEDAYLDFYVESEGKKTFSSKEELDTLNVDNTGQTFSISFPVKSDMDSYTIGCSVIKDGSVLDTYSVSVRPEKFASDEIRSTAEFIGNDSLMICLLDEFGNPAESDVSVFVSYPDSRTKVVANNLSVFGCSGIGMTGAVPGKYSVRIIGSSGLDEAHELRLKDMDGYGFPDMPSEYGDYYIFVFLASAAVAIVALAAVIRRRRRRKILPLIQKGVESKGVLL